MANSGLANDTGVQTSFSDYIIYFILAFLFFVFGRSFDRIREQLRLRRKKRDFKNIQYSKLSLNAEEEDSQDLPLVDREGASADIYKSKFEEAEKDIRKLNQSISALRQTEQRLNADNTVLKNKIARLEGQVAASSYPPAE